MLVNRHMRRSHIEAAPGRFEDYKFRRKHLTISYVQKKMDRLKYQRLFAHNLDLYQKFYLVSDWPRIGRAEGEGPGEREAPADNARRLGQSNLELFDKMYGDTGERPEMRGEGDSQRGAGTGEDGVQRFRLENAPPNVNDKNFDFRVYEYHRKRAHFENLEYLVSRLEK